MKYFGMSMSAFFCKVVCQKYGRRYSWSTTPEWVALFLDQLKEENWGKFLSLYK